MFGIRKFLRAALRRDTPWWLHATPPPPMDGECLYATPVCTPDEPCTLCLEGDGLDTECPGHEYMTDEDSVDVDYCGGSCLGARR